MFLACDPTYPSNCNGCYLSNPPDGSNAELTEDLATSTAGDAPQDVGCSVRGKGPSCTKKQLSASGAASLHVSGAGALGGFALAAVLAAQH